MNQHFEEEEERLREMIRSTFDERHAAELDAIRADMMVGLPRAPVNARNLIGNIQTEQSVEAAVSATDDGSSQYLPSAEFLLNISVTGKVCGLAFCMKYLLVIVERCCELKVFDLDEVATAAGRAEPRQIEIEQMNFPNSLVASLPNQCVFISDFQVLIQFCFLTVISF